MLSQSDDNEGGTGETAEGQQMCERRNLKMRVTLHWLDLAFVLTIKVRLENYTFMQNVENQ